MEKALDNFFENQGLEKDSIEKLSKEISFLTGYKLIKNLNNSDLLNSLNEKSDKSINIYFINQGLESKIDEMSHKIDKIHEFILDKEPKTEEVEKKIDWDLVEELQASFDDELPAEELIRLLK